MPTILYSMLIGLAAIGIALLSVFDIVPVGVAQYVPLIAVPFIVSRRRSTCTARAC